MESIYSQYRAVIQKTIVQCQTKYENLNLTQVQLKCAKVQFYNIIAFHTANIVQ